MSDVGVTTSGPQPAKWLFDEECVFCSGAVAFTLRHERAPTIRFGAIRSPEGRELAGRHGIDADAADTFLFVEDGRALARSDAVTALARHLRAPASWLRFSTVLPRPLRDAAYSWLARHRYRLFGRRRCPMPSPQVRARFVLPPEHDAGGAPS